MTSKDKVLEFMYANRHNLEADWTEDLEQMNIWDDVSFIYDAPLVKGDNRIGNTILCFTVFAYNNKSRFLEPHKNRWENKKRIIVTLAGLSALTTMIYPKVIDNSHKESFELSTWYIKHQKDWRWETIIGNIEFHSMAIKMSTAGAIDAQEAVQIGKMLDASKKLRADADEMMDELQTEFMNLDTAMDKEHREKVTDVNVNFMSYEAYLDTLKKSKAS